MRQGFGEMVGKKGHIACSQARVKFQGVECLPGT